MHYWDLFQQQEKISLKYWSLSQTVHTLFTTGCASRLLLEPNQQRHYSASWIYILSTNNSSFRDWVLEHNPPPDSRGWFKASNPCLGAVRLQQKVETGSVAWQKLDKPSGSVSGQGLIELSLYQVHFYSEDSTKSGHSPKIMENASDYWLLKTTLDDQ